MRRINMKIPMGKKRRSNDKLESSRNSKSSMMNSEIKTNQSATKSMSSKDLTRDNKYSFSI